MNPEDVRRIFRLMDNMFNFDDMNNFSGGYMSGTPNSYAKYRYGNGLEDPENYNIDIYEDDKHIYFTVELRGVRDEDMNVVPKENSIQLEVMTEGKWYKKEFRLPSKIKPESSKISFNNYVLDIVLEKKNESVQSVQEGNTAE